MADPTSAISLGNNPYSIDINRREFVIKTSEALVRNALVSLDNSTGKVEFADDAANLIPCGLLESPSDGDNSHLTGNGTYKAVVVGGIVVRWAVTGATAITDIGKFVYATDGQTLTLTQPTTGLPHGIVVNWISSTTCDVYLFDYLEAIKASMAKGNSMYEVLDIATITSNSLSSTSAGTFFTFPASYRHFKIISLHAQSVSFDTGIIAGAQTLNLDIGGTNTTGGVLTLGFANCDAIGDLGTAINATAITADNEVHQGDVLKLEVAASGTGFTAAKEGAFKVYAIIQVLPGA